MHHLDLHLGRPLTRGALTLFPVWNGATVDARGYDLSADHLLVAELPDGPTVDRLAVTNSGPRPVLVLEGELLEGGWQHRVAARSMLVRPGSSTGLEVRCVEQRRWAGGGRHDRRGNRAPVRVRARVPDGQQAVWEQVGRYEHRYGASATASLIEVTRPVEQRATELVLGVNPLPYCTGVLVGIGGQPVMLEVFDSPRTLQHAWDQLLRAAAVDAVDHPPLPTPGRRARRFVERLTDAPVLDERPAGLGRERTAATAQARMRNLVWRGRAVHTVAVNPRHELVAA